MIACKVRLLSSDFIHFAVRLLTQKTTCLDLEKHHHADFFASSFAKIDHAHYLNQNKNI